MFRKILVFEIKNAFRRPAVYLYWLSIFVFTLIPFSTGALPVGEKEFINAPVLIALWCAGMTMFMMVVSSSVMGMPLYRDIECNTKDYYLTYPITKAGYFFGRFCGGFFLMIVIIGAVPLGILIASKLGPAMHWVDASRYGSNVFYFYLHPLLFIALPNLLFTACIFFGLVSVTRNIKVIYSGGILLFMGYLLSQFLLGNTDSANTMIIADPFALNAIRFQTMNATSFRQNHAVISISGAFLINRIGWSVAGLFVLVYTYARFNFSKFFSGSREKTAPDPSAARTGEMTSGNATVQFNGVYNRQALLALIKIELNNILKDNYFWIIIGAGLLFFGFSFWMGNNFYGIPSFPLTVTVLRNFDDQFMFFIFFVLLFYTGETLHRDKATRYDCINDSLPVPNRILNSSKILSLLLLAAGLSFIPLMVGLPVQLLRGFHQFNFPFYLQGVFAVILPRLLEMTALCYFLHVVINNKFAAHGAAIAVWAGLFFLHGSPVFNYTLLQYSYTPDFSVADMDGMGHMMTPVLWFNLYWTLAGAVLLLIAALFYSRGVSTSFKERIQLMPERFDLQTRIVGVLMVTFFLATAAWNYYNTSYLNQFFSRAERNERAAKYERQLKKYAGIPTPKVAGLRIQADLFPEEREERIDAFVTIVNKNSQPVKEVLLDGDELTDYAILYKGAVLPYTAPLIYPKGKMDFFHTGYDTADFRLYQLPQPLLPGDTMEMEVRSVISSKGFSNNLQGTNLLRNGIFFTGGLPGLGYDEDDEIRDANVRKEKGLPVKEFSEIAQGDIRGTRNLKSGPNFDLLNYDLTVSTEGDQQIVTSGICTKKWTENGRNFFHYGQDGPGMYGPLVILSARYNNYRDTVTVNGKRIPVNIAFLPAHNFNKMRFATDCKDGIEYFSKAYGDYPFSSITMAETSIYTPRSAAFSNLLTCAEYFLWDIDFNHAKEFDYSYFELAHLVGDQWWRYQVASNNTVGSIDIPSGLAAYGALVLEEKKYGLEMMSTILHDKLRTYLFLRTRDARERPVIDANSWYEFDVKAGNVLYGLKDLIGEDSMNIALQEFRNNYAFKNKAPFAGANDLFDCLKKHTPDSLQYYLNDTWKQVTLYDNKITAVTAVPTGNASEFKVTIQCNVEKTHLDEKGNDIPDAHMQDYIDIGVFGTDLPGHHGTLQGKPLYIKKYKLTAGEHTIVIMVQEKPIKVGIDPYAKLIDHIPADNLKNIDY